MTFRLFSKNLWNESRGKFEPGLIEFEGKKISALTFGQPEGKTAKQKILDLDGLYIGPSAIDLHVHSRDFDESHKETLESAESAAFKGGVSTMACMANTRPRLDSPARIQEFLKLSRRRWARILPFASVTKNLEGVEVTDWDKLLKLSVAGLSDDGKPILDEKIFRGAALATKRFGKILSLHEEDTRISKASQMHLSEVSMRLGIEGSKSEAEFSLVARDLKIAEELKAPIHLGHLSTAESVRLLRTARRRGVLVSAELTPHHGLLSVDDAETLPLEKLSNIKVCPPIRSREDRYALRKGILDGSLDCFASDHAPHSRFEKELPYDHAMHGLISLENFFPLYNELRLQTQMKWKTFYSCLYSRAASLLPQISRLGKFERGYEASFIVFDPNLANTLKWERSKSSNSVFGPRKIRGVVFQHWIQGKKVYDIIKGS